jgi:outer membrane protein
VKLFISTLLAMGIVALAILISGCVSHKPPPPIIHANNYTAETLQGQQVLPPSDRILGLKEAIRIGLTNNPTYQQKHLAIVTAWATFYNQLAGYSPTLSVNFGAHQNQSSQAAVGSGSSTAAFSNVSTTWSYGLNAGWNVFNGFQTTFNVLAARDQALSAEELDRDYRRQLIYLITHAYNSILLSRARIQIDLSNEAYNKQQLKDGLSKFNAGASTLTDLLNFKIGEDEALNDVVKDTAEYKINRYVLAALMGLTTADLPEETQFPPIKVVESAEYSLAVEFFLDLAITQRPDLKAAKLNLDALRYSLYSSWGSFSPTVDLSMGYGMSRRSNGNWGNSSAVPRGQDLLYNYGFTVGWDIWKGGQRIANVRIAQAALDSQEEALTNTWITIVKEVRTAYTNLLSNETQRKILLRVLNHSKQRRDLIREEYNTGDTDITNLNQAQNTLVKNELNHITAVINVSNSRAKLDEACGSNVCQ